MIIKENINGVEVILETGNYYFSPQNVDKGTLLMLNKVQVSESDKVLDLGCGYGVVGIYVAKKIGGERVVMSDVLRDAIALSKQNLELNNIDNVKVIKSDGLNNVTDEDFTLIMSNPPYHTDFSVAKSFIEDGFKKLVVGGRIVMVTKRLNWYKNKIEAVFGGVKIYEVEGYYIFIGEKRKKNVLKHTLLMVLRMKHILKMMELILVKELL